jgi:MFS family permease
MVESYDKETGALETEELKTKKERNIILGMVVKKETTFANTLAIPLIFCTTTAAGAYYNM